MTERNARIWLTGI